MRSQKDHRKDEKKIMRNLGARPQPLSGAGDVFKEDGESPIFLYQLKSTEKESYSLKLLDILILIKNAIISNKIPVFVINFVKGPRLVCFKEEDVHDIILELEKQREIQNNTIDAS
ncbi:MAG TPA: hypothetical protein VL443_08175 [Cyclobacteriaceae bacterium]|jgi:hypothetical protein|nr:hypothetical protein [Cyclobacteriaceae bacterium]